MDKLISSV